MKQRENRKNYPNNKNYLQEVHHVHGDKYYEFSWVDFWLQALGGSLLLVEIYSSKEVLSRYHHSPRLKFLPLTRGSVIKWCDIWLPATLLCRLCQVTFCLALQRLQLSRVILILCSFRQFVSNFPVHKTACKALFGSQFLGDSGMTRISSQGYSRK